MPVNKIPRLREPRGPIVQQVRDLFLEQEYKQAPEDFYPQDIELIERMDFLLQRYVIMQRKNVEASVKMVSQMLRWRKERKLYEMNDRQFPQELTISGAAFLYEEDKFGNRTLYLRTAMCKNCAELKFALKDFLTYLVFQLDDCKDGTTYAVIMDLTNATLSNYDIDLLMHIIQLLKDYFPVNLDYFLAVNFPWILSAVWSLIKRLIPTEKRDAVQFISSSKIFDFVDKEKCPDFLGGTCTRPYAYLNEEAPTTIEYLLQHAIKPPTRKRMREILSQFCDALPEAQVEKLKRQIEEYDESKFVAITAGGSDESQPASEQLAKLTIKQHEDTNNNEVQVDNRKREKPK